MRRIGLFGIAIAAATVVIGGCSKPASEERVSRGVAVGTGGAASNVKSDAEFVQDVAIMNMAEIELSRMALEKATTPNIKAFAQSLIADHDAAGNKLKTIVSGRSNELPAQLDDKHRELANDLAKKQGADFDREYMEAMIEGHENIAARLESRLDVQSLADWKTAAAARTQSATLPEPKAEMGDVQPRPNNSGNELTMKINQWAAETYPVVQKHLDTARTLENAAKKRSTD
jgi:predicted outer membrane protein